MNPMFGSFNDRVIGLSATSFSPMYRRVFEKYWRNAMFHKMPRAYNYSNYEEGIFEFYLPTFDRLEEGVNYQRIVIKTLPGLDPEIMEEEAKKLRRQRFVCHGRGPNGRIDSESIFLVAPRLSPEGLAKWQEDKRRERVGLKPKKEWVCRAKHPHPGTMIMPIINRLPESCVKRMLVLLANFLQKRLNALLKTFNLSPSTHFGKQHPLYYIHSINIIETISLTLSNTIKCISHAINWFRLKIKQIYGEIGRQNTIIMVARKIGEIKPLLREITSNHTPFKTNPEPQLLTVLTNILSGPGPPR